MTDPVAQVKRVGGGFGSVAPPSDPEPRRKRRQKDVKTGFSPLARRGRVHEPLRRRRRPRTRQVRGVERLRRRHDPPGVRRAGLGRTASTLRAGPRFVANASAHDEPRPRVDLDPWYELVAEKEFNVDPERRCQPGSSDLACSATPARATFPASAGAQNSVTGRPRDALDWAGLARGPGGACTARRDTLTSSEMLQLWRNGREVAITVRVG